MNILALDLGTKTGWAFIDHGHIESGVQDFSAKRGESAGMRYLHFRRWLFAIAGVPPAPRVDLIVYEMPHLRGGAAATVLAGLQTRVEEFCAEMDIEHAPVHSATLKKFTTGSGRGDKLAMQQASIERGWWGFKGNGMVATDDNEVDAVCLLHYALAEIVPATP